MMKTITFFVIIACLQVNLVSAQQVARPQQSAISPQGSSPTHQMNPGQPQQMSKEMMTKMEVSRLKSQLVLTDSQTVKVEKIVVKYVAERDELLKKLSEMRVKQNAEIKPILTPEQLEKLNKMMMPPSRPPSMPGEKQPIQQKPIQLPAK